jgi:small subunit ribosomal protein S4
MGDPRKLRKKYETPRHPWQASRIAAEKPLIVEYGLKNKKEIWKAQSLLRKFTSQAKELSTLKTDHDKNELKKLLIRLNKLGLLKENAEREDVLGLNIKNVLDRRLQTLLIKKGFAKTAKQSRQLITHGHISINNQKINVPSYLVNVDDENKINYLENSPFINNEHPETILIKQAFNNESKEEKKVLDKKKKRRQ